MIWIEALAVIFGLLCVGLTVKQNILCWPTGLIQVLLYIYIFYITKLYSDMLLHFVYVILQLYGWHHWLYGGKDKNELSVTRLHSSVLIMWMLIGFSVTAIWGYIMARHTDAAVPYADSFTTVMSLIAQWLMTRKKLESWYFWVLVDIVAIGVYWYKELYLTTGLYAIFLVLAVSGYYCWKATAVKYCKATEIAGMVEV